MDRCNAAQALGKMREYSANAALLARLHDDDIDVCVDVATALGEISSGDSLVALTESALQDSSGEVRVAALKALAKFKGSVVAKTLIKCVVHRPDNLEYSYDGGWDPWWDIQLVAVQALGKLGDQTAVPSLVSLLESDEAADIEDELFKALALIGGPGEAYLIDSLAKANDRQRRRIARALSLSATTDAWQALLSGLEDQNADVRVAILQSLVGFQALDKFEPLLITFTRDRNPFVRAAIATLLTQLDPHNPGKNNIDQQLANLLSDEQSMVRVAVIDGLCKQDARECDIALDTAIHERLDDESTTVSASVCCLLRHWKSERSIPVLLRFVLNPDKDNRIRVEAIRTLACAQKISDEIVDVLKLACNDPSEPIRSAAIAVLMQLIVESPVHRDNHSILPADEGPVGDPIYPSFDFIRDLIFPEQAIESAELETGLGTVRAEVAHGDQGTNTSPAVAPVHEQRQESNGVENSAVETAADVVPMSTLESILRDSSRIAAEQSDSDVYDPFAQMAELSEDMQDYADVVRKTVKEREAWFDKKRVLTSTDSRHLATRLLGECDIEVVIETLLTAMADADDDLRCDAAASLARIAERNPDMAAMANAWGALVTHLKTDDRSVRLSCARALGALRQRKSITVLCDALAADDDASVRTGVIDALASVAATCVVDHPKRRLAVGLLAERCSDSDNAVGRAAAIALLDLGDEQTLQTSLSSLIQSENALGLLARTRMIAIRHTDVFEKILINILSSCTDSVARQPVIEHIGEIYQVGEPIT